MHCFAEPGKLPTSYVMCTQGQRQIGQDGSVWSSVVLLSAMYVDKVVTTFEGEILCEFQMQLDSF